MGKTEATHAPAVLYRDDFTRHEIVAELRAHQDLIYEFAKAWYRSPYTFRATRVFGYVACKIPLDLWIFHDLFNQYRFRTVIECGTAGGGSALWFATLMDLLKIDGGMVYTIDVDDEADRPTHDRIVYVHGNTTDPAIVERVARNVVGPTMVNLDSDHHAPHVLRELELYAPLVPVGGWLVVEDTNGSPVETDPATGQPVGCEGPFAAVMEYLATHPGEFTRDVVCERYWLTMNPYGWLQRMASHRGDGA